MFSTHYRRDGSQYPDTEEGLLEYAADFGSDKRVLKQTMLWNGLWVSTIWLGIDYSRGRSVLPMMFESMVFDHISGEDTDEQLRYTSEEEALEGHEELCRIWGRILPTIHRWWRQSTTQSEEDMEHAA